MPKPPKPLLIGISTAVFTFLFYENTLGLNLTLFAWFIIALVHYSVATTPKGTLYFLCMAGTLLVSLMVTINYSVISIVTTILSLLLYSAVASYTSVRSYSNAAILLFYNFLLGPMSNIKDVFENGLKNQRSAAFLWSSRIFILPVFIILIFVAIYSASNPVFDNIVNETGIFFSNIFGDLFEHVNALLLFTITFGLIVSTHFLSPFVYAKIANNDSVSSSLIVRVRNKINSGRKSMIALKYEIKAAVFLFAFLNVILLTINIIDLNWVWLNFEWEGEYLKQFVHEGTYLLILSILISMGLVLYFFRGNINFIASNKLLRSLSIVWLIQNGFLALSVGMRNYWYIQNFALAYKRIGVYIFLILTLIGIVTVLVKVLEKRSFFYLLQTNATALFIVLVLTALINWDIVIAKYNIRNFERSFVHWDYLSTLSDKTLPYLDLETDKLEEIGSVQAPRFPFEYQYMNPSDFKTTINSRKSSFLKNWESKSLLSWNYAEYKAYKRIVRQNYPQR